MAKLSIDISKGQVHPSLFVRFEQSMKITSYRKEARSASLVLFVSPVFPHPIWEIESITAMLP